MSAEITSLPISEKIAVDSERQVSELLKSANEDLNAVYVVGGGTSLGLGLPGKRAGIALETTGLDHIVDYPARDMTITTGAGMTLEKLAQTLAPEKQRLPIDAPTAHRATLGGLIASNHSGPLRYGHGTMRDHVIGIRAVDGRGDAFAAGGRVVKNVAGYDFCKLLTGSLGTLGVITEVTLKLKPIPPAEASVCCAPRDFQHAEQLLAQIVGSKTAPVVVELLAGAGWEEVPQLGMAACGWLVVSFEGTEVEVDWMCDQIAKEWRGQNVDPKMLRGDDHLSLRQRLIEFPADDQAALVAKLTGVPSRVTHQMQSLLERETSISLQAHAGNGIVIAKFAEPPAVSMVTLKSLASAASGTATILSNPSGNEMTHHSVWGAADVPFDIMQRIKDAFDPNNVLNPGRFVYHR